MKEWSNCRQILVIRLDNMGDVLMSSPAVRAVHETFSAELTLLTSSKGAEIAKLIPEFSRVITFDVPWVKIAQNDRSCAISGLVESLKTHHFDGCIIFTVYSQSALPAAMIAYMAGISLRLAYCRENPYQLLTHWLPDQEPYKFIRHQVERDLYLVSSIGAATTNHFINLDLPPEALKAVDEKLAGIGAADFIILHPGVSEKKRRYPMASWVNCAKMLVTEINCKVILTGSLDERSMLEDIANQVGAHCFPMGGIFSIAELTTLIERAMVIISVNTSVVHLASAMQTPVVVLYAQTNPQHYPWKVKSKVLEYSIAEEEKSKNEVIRFVNEQCYPGHIPLPDETDVLAAVRSLGIEK